METVTKIVNEFQEIAVFSKSCTLYVSLGSECNCAFLMPAIFKTKREKKARIFKKILDKPCKRHYFFNFIEINNY